MTLQELIKAQSLTVQVANQVDLISNFYPNGEHETCSDFIDIAMSLKAFEHRNAQLVMQPHKYKGKKVRPSLRNVHIGVAKSIDIPDSKEKVWDLLCSSLILKINNNVPCTVALRCRRDGAAEYTFDITEQLETTIPTMPESFGF